MYWSAGTPCRDSLSKDRGLGAINSKTSFSHRSGGWTSKVKVAAALLFPGASAWFISGCLLVHVPPWCLFRPL